jgi:thiol-disulfide isomerase/thioredoxin
MQKNVIVCVTVALFVVFGGWFLIKSTNTMKEESIMSNKDIEKNINKENAVMMKSGEKVMEKDTMINEVNTGVYEAYNPEKIAMAEHNKVVLFFYAPWCPTCQSVDKEINANPASIPKSLIILKTDYDSMKDLKKKYGVTYQHTI